MAYADNSRKVADRGEAGWDRDRVREAIDAYRRAVQLGPEKPIADRAANNMAWLQLKVLNLPREAFESTTRLQAIENSADIKIEHIETLGAVYVGVRQYDKAVGLLEQAIRTRGATAGFCIYLALAHHGLGNQQLAEKYLKRAGDLQPTPRELFELRDATTTILGR